MNEQRILDAIEALENRMVKRFNKLEKEIEIIKLDLQEVKRDVKKVMEWTLADQDGQDFRKKLVKSK